MKAVDLHSLDSHTSIPKDSEIILRYRWVSIIYDKVEQIRIDGMCAGTARSTKPKLQIWHVEISQSCSIYGRWIYLQCRKPYANNANNASNKFPFNSYSPSRSFSSWRRCSTCSGTSSFTTCTSTPACAIWTSGSIQIRE